MRYIFLLLLFSSCSQVIFTPSAHVGIYPPQRIEKGTKINFSAKFGNDLPYLYGNANQSDWNKLCGLAMFTNPHKETAMVVFRWNPETLKIEIAPYYHFTNRTSFDESTSAVGSGTARAFNSFVSYDLNEEIIGEIELDTGGYWIVSFYRSDERILYDSQSTGLDQEKCRGIQPWWGGQEKPPTRKVVSLDLKYF